VRIAAAEAAVSGDLVHLLVVAHFEDGGEEIQAIGAGLLADLLFGREELWGEGV